MFSLAQPIYPVAGIRSIENQVHSSAEPSLMERAGRAAAEEAVQLTMDRPGPILIACGPGNNGGDGFVMARRLLQAQRPITLAFAGDANKLPPDAKAAFRAWREAGGETLAQLPPEQDWSLVVDALFGIGLQRPVTGRYADWIERLNALPSARLAIDIPSGLDADTGRALGTVFHATHTLTFLAFKPGLLTSDGPDYAGNLIVRTLDITPTAYLKAPGLRIQPALFRECLKPRRNNTHKGSYGEIGIVGGAPGMIGAALLAGRAALKLGAGRVFVGLLDENGPVVDFSQPEIMLHKPQAVLEKASVLAIGPGLGESDEAIRWLEYALLQERPLVLDADALNLLARETRLHALISKRASPTLLTPHPGEASHLLGMTTEAVQANRIGSALSLARKYQSIILLKGCGSIIAMPEGNWFINSTGHPGMASAGMGDILTGIIASLLGQGWPAEQAIMAAANLHGTAADRLAREGIGPIGLTANEVIDASRNVLNDWDLQAGHEH